MDQGKEISEVILEKENLSEDLEETSDENLDEANVDVNGKVVSVYLDRIEELEDGTAEAVLLFDDENGDSAQIVLPANFLPDDVSDGDYLTLKLSYDAVKTQAALDLARQLLNK